jgi:hypothetical protein
MSDKPWKWRGWRSFALGLIIGVFLPVLLPMSAIYQAAKGISEFGQSFRNEVFGDE